MISLYATLLIIVIVLYVVIGVVILLAHEYYDGIEPWSVRFYVVFGWGMFLFTKK
jgi:hypothetical protein